VSQQESNALRELVSKYGTDWPVICKRLNAKKLWQEQPKRYNQVCMCLQVENRLKVQRVVDFTVSLTSAALEPRLLTEHQEGTVDNWYA
jgi:hypothetical protein